MRFSSEICPFAQQWIGDNFRPKTFYKDMLQRDMDMLPDKCGGYVVGFPCQPWSFLNSRNRAWRDPRAKVVACMLASFVRMQPKWGLFENVFGLRRYFAKFFNLCRRHGIFADYHVLVLPLCPHQILQEPIRRKRLFICLIRKDLAITADQALLRGLVERLVQAAARTSSHVPLQGLLQHSRPTAAAEFTDRVRGIIQQEVKKYKVDPARPLVLDISQSAGRVPRGFGVVPCLTLSSALVLHKPGQGLARISGLDKLVLHGVPVEKYRVAKEIEEKLHRLCGNSMHVAVVGLAMTVCFALIDWTRTAQTKSKGGTNSKPIIWHNFKEILGTKKPRAKAKKSFKTAPPKRKAAVSRRHNAGLGKQTSGQAGQSRPRLAELLRQ